MQILEVRCVMARHFVICLVLDKLRKNIEIKYVVFLYIYILGSALRDSAFLFARTFGRVSRKSSEEVFHICAKFNDHRSCSSRHKIIKLPYE